MMLQLPTHANYYLRDLQLSNQLQSRESVCFQFAPVNGRMLCIVYQVFLHGHGPFLSKEQKCLR